MKYAILLLVLLAQETTEKGTARVRPSLSVEAPFTDLLAPYEIADKEFAYELKLLKDGAKVAVYELTYPSPIQTDDVENNTVWAKFWLPKNDEKKRPAVVLLHWLGGSFAALEMVGQKMADDGIATLMIWMPHYGKRRSKDPAKREEMINTDFDRTAANLRQAVLDVRRAGDWLASRKDVDRFRLGLMGISLGSVVGALTAGVDPHFMRIVLVIGGGDLAAVCMNDSKETRKIKEKLEADGTTVDELRRKLKGVEPLTFAPRVDGSRVLMINAENDEVIPKACTEKLWEAYAKPKISWYKSTHTGIVLALGQVLKEAVEHLKTRPLI